MCCASTEKHTLLNVPYEVKLMKVFFWHTLHQDISYVCFIQKAIRELMSKLKQGEYLYRWHKAIDILKHDGHLLFGGFKSQHGNNDDKIVYAYKKLMSLVDTLLKMSLFFASMQMRALGDIM
jgi:hypothetical protein